MLAGFFVFLLLLIGVLVVYLTVVVFFPQMWAWGAWFIKNALLWLGGLTIGSWIIYSIFKNLTDTPSYSPPPPTRPDIDPFARAAAKLTNRVKTLRRQAADDPAMLDPVYRENYARAQARQIVAKLKKEWDDEYWDVMEDEALKTELQEKAPEVLEWLEARRDLGMLATRIAVEKRKKPSIDDVRTQIVNRLRTQVLDKFAIQQERIRLMQDVRRFLDEAELSPDERELLEAEMWQFIQGAADGPSGSGRVI